MRVIPAAWGNQPCIRITPDPNEWVQIEARAILLPRYANWSDGDIAVELEHLVELDWLAKLVAITETDDWRCGGSQVAGDSVWFVPQWKHFVPLHDEALERSLTALMEMQIALLSEEGFAIHS